MLTSEIIAYGRSLANIPSTNFFTDADALRAVNASWKDIYSVLTLEDDDYFVTSVTTSTGALTPYSGRENTFTYALPADFFRLRLVQYQDGSDWKSLQKMTLAEFGNWQNTPAYIMKGTNLVICDETSRTYEIWYYPAPVPITLTPDFDVKYPFEVIPEIIAYQVAIEIERKSKQPPGTIQMMEARRNELFTSFRKQVRRDDFNNIRVTNVYQSGGMWR